MIGKKLLGQSVLLGRDREGLPFAMRDLCPHRGIPLSHGRFDGDEIECCFHGWRFNCQGSCTHIPSLLPTQKFDLDRVKLSQFSCREVQGNIWVFMPDEQRKRPDPLPTIPEIPGVDERHHRLVESSIYECTIDQAAIGLLDPAHGPFVHQNWWWRSGKTIQEKSKDYGPSKLGFTMLRHRPSSNAKIYKLLGGEATTEIRFELPSTRIEHIRVGRNHICGVSTQTPLTDNQVEMHQTFYWTIPWLTMFRPLIRPLVRQFLKQDQDVVGKQRAGLNEDPQLMLINDADKLARWYFQLKKEYQQSRAEGREFCNPLVPTTLKWRT
jgi:phenylpropionate dioxygenase-like ring-hydroxylating dioxygenase large terminal subunit